MFLLRYIDDVHSFDQHAQVERLGLQHTEELYMLYVYYIYLNLLLLSLKHFHLDFWLPESVEREHSFFEIVNVIEVLSRLIFHLKLALEDSLELL
jgi:hypothetical protein